MKAFALITFILTVTVVPTFAAPKTKTYPASCDRIWIAVKRATVPPHYDFATLDDKQKKGIVSIHRVSLGVTLTDSGDSCTVAIGETAGYAGLIHNLKDDLFKHIEAEFKEAASPESTPPKK